MSAGVLATTAHAEGGTRRGRHTPRAALPGAERPAGPGWGGLQDGRVGALPRDDQPHPVALARVQAREVGANRRRTYIADDGDLRWAVQQDPDAHGGPRRRGGPDLVRGDLRLSPVGQLGAGSEDEAQEAVGADGRTGQVRQLDAVAGQQSVQLVGDINSGPRRHVADRPVEMEDQMVTLTYELIHGSARYGRLLRRGPCRVLLACFASGHRAIRGTADRT